MTINSITYATPDGPLTLFAHAGDLRATRGLVTYKLPACPQLATILADEITGKQATQQEVRLIEQDLKRLREGK